jgi:hypothetical protein
MAGMATGFHLSGPINLEVRIAHGSVTVDAVDNLEQAQVNITGPREEVDRIDVGMDGPTLTISGPRQNGVFDLIAERLRSSTGVAVAVTVPSGTALRIVTFTAGITVRGRCGGADIGTGTGRMELAEVDGDLQLRSGSSTAVVHRVTGSVVVRSGSGDARIGEILGGLQAGSGAGRLHVGTVRGRVRSRTGSGDAQFDAVYGDVDLASGSGGMSIGLPGGLTARLDVKTGSGKVRSDLPIADQPKSSQGAITVRARTGSGNVRLFRAA